MVTDEQRRGVAQALLLRPTTAVEFQRLSRLNALYLLLFAMAARGATARDMAWSDIAVNTFPGIITAGGTDQPVLCFYVLATKTTEGVVRCFGALPHVDEWACVAGGVAGDGVARRGERQIVPEHRNLPDREPCRRQALVGLLLHDADDELRRRARLALESEHEVAQVRLASASDGQHAQRGGRG